MKENLIITLNALNHPSVIWGFITAMNQTNNLTARLLPKSEGQDYYEIEIYNLNS